MNELGHIFAYIGFAFTYLSLGYLSSYIFAYVLGVNAETGDKILCSILAFITVPFGLIMSLCIPFEVISRLNKRVTKLEEKLGRKK